MHSLKVTCKKYDNTKKEFLTSSVSTLRRGLDTVTLQSNVSKHTCLKLLAAYFGVITFLWSIRLIFSLSISRL